MSRGKQNRQDMTYHDNVVRFNLKSFELAKDSTGHYGYFIMKEHFITDGQDPKNKVNDTTYYINEKGELSFSFGRQGSSDVADWWKERITANHTTFDHNPDDLNFAAIGELILNVKLCIKKRNAVINQEIKIKDVAIAQGHAGASNNWWFGGTNLPYIGNHSVVSKDESKDYTIRFLRGGNDTNEIDVFFDNNWIKKLDPKKKLTNITIPGTHDSGAVYKTKLGSLARCQNSDIQTQLSDGIRFFDVRLNEFLQLSHTLPSSVNFIELVSLFKAHLKVNHNDFIIMLVGKDSAEWDKMGRIFQLVLWGADFNNNIFIDYIPDTIEQAYGKVIVLKRQKDCPFGLYVDIANNTTASCVAGGYKFVIEDLYNPHSDEDNNNPSEVKHKAVVDNLNNARSSSNDDTFYITFNSIQLQKSEDDNTYITPYMYAWGEKDNKKHVSCPENPALLDYLNQISKKKSRLGVVLMDYYNDEQNNYDLIDTLIQTNFEKDIE